MVAAALPPRAHAEPSTSCSNLAIQLVEPEVPTDPAQIQADRAAIESLCNGYDESLCTGAKVGARFKRSVRGELERIHVRARAARQAELDSWLVGVLKSPVYRRMSALRIEARRAAGWSADRWCEPNLAVVSAQSVADLGFTTIVGHPVVVSGGGGGPTTNEREMSGLMLLEEGHLGMIPIFSLDALKRADYLDYTISHEMGHALLQDLYGVGGTQRLLEGKLVSREGHFASERTDPAMAWVEGFSEGFEAYLGEQFPGSIDHEGVDPAIHLVMSRLRENSGYLMDEGLGSYPEFVANLMEIFVRTAPRMDDVMAELLRRERQGKVRGGFYVLDGRFGNLAYDYGLMDQLTDGFAAIEDGERIQVKEGVIATAVYLILKRGMAREMFEVIHEARPADFREFYQALAAALPAGRREVFERDLTSITTVRGRRSVVASWELQYGMGFELEQVVGETLAWEGGSHRAEEEVTDLPIVRDGWIQFDARTSLRASMSGLMDRINLFTAADDRIREYFRKTDYWGSHGTELPEKVRGAAVSAWKNTVREVAAPRDWMAAATGGLTFQDLPSAFPFDEALEKWTSRLREQAENERDDLLASWVGPLSEELRKARRCYVDNCHQRAH